MSVILFLEITNTHITMFQIKSLTILAVIAATTVHHDCSGNEKQPTPLVIENQRMRVYKSFTNPTDEVGKYTYWIRDADAGWQFTTDAEFQVGDTIVITATPAPVEEPKTADVPPVEVIQPKTPEATEDEPAR